MHSTQANILISSSNPTELGEFYSQILCSQLTTGFTKDDFLIKNDMSLPIRFFRPSTNSQPSDFAVPSIAICLSTSPSPEPLKVIEGYLKDIVHLGGQIITPPKLEKFGAEAWFSDIEDNKALIFVPLKRPNH